ALRSLFMGLLITQITIPLKVTLTLIKCLKRKTLKVVSEILKTSRKRWKRVALNSPMITICQRITVFSFSQGFLMQYKKIISKEEINALPLFEFEGKTQLITTE